MTIANPPLPVWTGGGLTVLVVVELERPELDDVEVVLLVGTQELAVVDGVGSKPSPRVEGAPLLVEEREVRLPAMACSRASAKFFQTYKEY